MIAIELRELNELADKYSFNRDTLEKVIRLSNILEFFNSQKDLKGRFVLKGGTAINLCLFDFPRLSVDIDMNYNSSCAKEEMLKDRTLHKKVLTDYASRYGYELGNDSRFTHTLDSYKFKYTNLVGNRDNIKIELNYSNRIQILEPELYTVNSKVVGECKILGSNKIELYSSKIAALVGRTTVRDLYDVSMMIDTSIIQSHELELLRKCSIFYLLNSNDENLDTLLSRFKEQMKGISSRQVRRRLIPLLKLGSGFNLETEISKVSEFIDKLFIVTEEEREFEDHFLAGDYIPSLLFEQSIADKIKSHPMALWKTSQLNKKN